MWGGCMIAITQYQIKSGTINIGIGGAIITPTMVLYRTALFMLLHFNTGIIIVYPISCSSHVMSCY